MRPFTVWTVLYPFTSVDLGAIPVLPNHGAVAVHFAQLPLTFVAISTRPQLFAVAMLLSSLPAAVIEGRAIGAVCELPLPMPLAMEPLAIIARFAVMRLIAPFAIATSTKQLTLVL